MTDPRQQDPRQKKQKEDTSMSQMELYIGDIDFPCNRDDLLAHARDRGASFDVLQVLERFPQKQYASTIDIVHGFTYAKRHRPH